jgi:hypothetical protein
MVEPVLGTMSDFATILYLREKIAITRNEIIVCDAGEHEFSTARVPILMCYFQIVQVIIIYLFVCQQKFDNII